MPLSPACRHLRWTSPQPTGTPCGPAGAAHPLSCAMNTWPHCTPVAAPRPQAGPCFLSLWQDETLIAAARCASRAIPTANMYLTGPGPTPMPSTACPTTQGSCGGAVHAGPGHAPDGAGRLCTDGAGQGAARLVRERRRLLAAHPVCRRRDLNACAQVGLMRARPLQFHWTNSPTLGTGVSSLPRGALAALGRPGGGSAAPRSALACPRCPRGGSRRQGGPAAARRPPRSALACPRCPRGSRRLRAARRWLDGLP